MVASSAAAEKFLLELIEKILREIVVTVRFRPGIRGKLARVLGSVAGRPKTEDVEIGVDRLCENIYQAWIQRYQSSHGLRIRVYSEHGTYGSENPEYLCAPDPFDGSGIFRRGLRSEWWSVVSFFDLKGEPLAGGAADILNRVIYLAHSEGVFCISLQDGEKSRVSPAQKKRVDNQTILAAYLMISDYLDPWAEMTKIIRNEHPGLFFWPNGGSCIYARIAEGTVHAYLMPNEPRSEIDPGLAFAKFAGFPVFSVEQGKVLQPYRFIPGRQADRVACFIAACTSDLARDIIEALKR